MWQNGWSRIQQAVPEGNSTGCRFDGERYYRLLGQGADVERKDFLCYQISTWKRLELGERVVLSIILESGKAIDIQTVAEICAESLLSATSTLWMNNRFDYLSTGTLLKGSIYRVEEPFDDAPKEGQFDWKGFARNLVAGLMLGVGFVALSVATGGLAGAVLMGAGVSVLMTTASMSISDFESGNVRSWEKAQAELTVAAICGAITGAVAFWAEGAFEGVKFLMSHPVVRKALVETISGTVDVVTGLMTRASEAYMDEDMTGEEKLAYIFDWGAIGFDFFTGMVIDLGLGGLKWLDGRRAAKKAAQEAAEHAAKEEAAERATHNTTGELMDDIDEYEQFYEDLFDRQRETFGEYDDFLDD